jgi:repressor LexA
MARKSNGLSDRHKRILVYLDEYQRQFGYPPSIREIGEKTGITSTSVVNYYLSQLESQGYIEREKNISRGIRLLKNISGLKQAFQNVTAVVDDIFHIQVIGRIAAGAPMPVPSSDFSYYDSETGIDIARSLLPPREKVSDLFALEVKGDSMIDAMVNDGDLVIMKRAQDAKNGEMVAVWLRDRDETTLKYFFREEKSGRVRLQPANPQYQPIYINDPQIIQVQGKVVLVIRRPNKLPA